MRRKPIRKHRRIHSRDLPGCVRASSVHAQRKFKDFPYFERNHKDQQENQMCHRGKMNVQSKERRNRRRCTEKNKEISQICSRQIEHSSSYKSDDSLNKKNSTNTDLKADKSDYCVCKKS